MRGHRIGYVRVSSLDQNPERQLEGEKLDKVFVERASGRDTNRPELEKLVEFAREGDTVVVHSMDRLARNLDDLRFLIAAFGDRQVVVEFIKESLNFTGDDSAMSKLLLSVMGAFAEFERSLILERQREGIALAKARGAYKGRPPSLSPNRITELRMKAAEGKQKAAIARDLGVSRATVYRYLRESVQREPVANQNEGAIT